MVDFPFATSNAPYGVDAPALDYVLYDASASGDVTLAKSCRSILVLSDGTLSVTTQAGVDPGTHAVVAGMVVSCCITHVLAATTSDLLLYV